MLVVPFGLGALESNDLSFLIRRVCYTNQQHIGRAICCEVLGDVNGKFCVAADIVALYDAAVEPEVRDVINSPKVYCLR